MNSLGKSMLAKTSTAQDTTLTRVLDLAFARYVVHFALHRFAVSGNRAEGHSGRARGLGVTNKHENL